MDKGEVGHDGQCRRMLEAPSGQSAPPISSSTVFVGEALVRSTRSTRNALKWTCARNTAHPPEINTNHKRASNIYGGKDAGRGRGSWEKSGGVGGWRNATGCGSTDPKTVQQAF